MYEKKKKGVQATASSVLGAGESPVLVLWMRLQRMDRRSGWRRLSPDHSAPRGRAHVFLGLP